ncbi:MAG: site-specific DNA-methyltransferase [Caldiserica bacterium]|nr:site-specific DNA-methyltransferase [Caldisericota bacterium]MDH7562663.1 site-specific DNA-methyltransferase [Caldisericota bacterium]
MNSLAKFQGLLRGLFQFDASDLDFGIYRILNYKRSQIEKFIQQDLKEKVDLAFAKYQKQMVDSLKELLTEKKQEALRVLGEEAFGPNGELKIEYRGTRPGKDYLEIRERVKEAEHIETIKDQVFNDLFTFFFRYYEEGDFVPHYRYSIKGHKYAIPYNGEEVKLYWANHDQYYTKTGLLFRDYTFKAGEYSVIFRIVSAKEELGSNKATKDRYFILDDENPLEIVDKKLIVRFQYRELTDVEVKEYASQTANIASGENEQEETEGLDAISQEVKAPKQDHINEKVFSELLGKIEDTEPRSTLSNIYKNDKALLLYQLFRFTSKSTKDYFIHKNLKRFLSEQLEYFIKSEVLDIETLEKANFLDKHITRAMVVKEIGETIIDFLAQIEDFQKRLWEIKKFVISTECVITLDKIKEYAGEGFLESILGEILKNENQLKEWKELFGIEITGENDLIENNSQKGKEWKLLPIDTRYFEEEFKWRLLGALSEKHGLDDILDGVLIKSENWQALNLLLSKYKEKVQTIYIDPPFNKEQDADYLYNVKYKDSTWISILENRLRLARDLLSDRGSIFVRCDYNGNMYVRLLMNEIFGEENFRNEMILKRTAGLPKREFLNMEVETEYLIYYVKDTEKLLFNQLWENREPQWMPVMIKYNRGGPTGKPIIIEGKIYNPPKGYSWAIGGEIAERIYKEGRLKIENGKLFVLIDKKTVGSNWTDIPGYVSPPKWGFSTENHEKLLKRVIETSSNENDLVMDFFLGSGTTTAVAHKLKRKWIGVEMGEHFYTVVLPRMKRVLAYDESGISRKNEVKEKYNKKTAGGFFKYQVIEQYEDALDNIELKENQQAQALLKDEYLLKYFLEFETRESPYLLNVDLLKNPFAYKLKVNLSEVGEPQEMVVDIPETFNYLLGLKVKRIMVRNNERKYLFVQGEKEGKEIAVVWREYRDDWSEEDFKGDKNYIINKLEGWDPHILYINGQSILTEKLGNKTVEIRYIEPEFKRLMEG